MSKHGRQRHPEPDLGDQQGSVEGTGSSDGTPRQQAPGRAEQKGTGCGANGRGRLLGGCGGAPEERAGGHVPGAEVPELAVDVGRDDPAPGTPLGPRRTASAPATPATAP